MVKISVFAAVVALALFSTVPANATGGSSVFQCKLQGERLVGVIEKRFSGQTCDIKSIKRAIGKACRKGLCSGLSRRDCARKIRIELIRVLFPKYCKDDCSPLVCKPYTCRTTIKRGARYPQNCPEKCEATSGCPNELVCSPDIPDCDDDETLNERKCACEECKPSVCKPRTCRTRFRPRAKFPYNCPEKCEAGLGCPNELTCSPDVPECPEGQTLNEKKCECEDDCEPKVCGPDSCPSTDKYPGNCPQSCSVTGLCPDDEFKCVAEIPKCDEGEVINKDNCLCEPDCDPKVCGPDSCPLTDKYPGNCPQSCSVMGLCPDDEFKCVAEIPKCDEGEVINKDNCLCEPDCDPKKCGPDSCPLTDKYPGNCPQSCSVTGLCPDDKFECTPEIPTCPDDQTVDEDTCKCSECSDRYDCPKRTCEDDVETSYECFGGICKAKERTCPCGCGRRNRCKKRCY